jgi:hypothetical protein
LEENDGGFAIFSAVVRQFDGGFDGLVLDRKDPLRILPFDEPFVRALENNELDRRLHFTTSGFRALPD